MLPERIREQWTSDRARVVTIAAILAMVTVNQCGTGILSVVIPVKLAADGYSASAAGAVSTTFSVFFLIGCILGPEITRRIGPDRTVISVAAINAGLALLHWSFPGPVTWAVFRGCGGVSTAVYFVLIESWLAAQATAETRGIVFGTYMVLNRLAFAFGQIVISFVAPSAATQLFVISALAYLTAPLLRPRAPANLPTSSRASLAGFLELPRLLPTAAMASMAHGLVFGTLPGLLPKWGFDAGIPVSTIGQGLAALQIGGMALQLPVSYAADRLDRRTVMAVVSVATAAISIAMIWVPHQYAWLWVGLLFLWGGCASTLYSLAAAHAGDLAPPERRLVWVSSIMLFWGTGAALGPLVAAAAMDRLGSSVLWSYAALASMALVAFLVWRKIVRP